MSGSNVNLGFSPLCFALGPPPSSSQASSERDFQLVALEGPAEAALTQLTYLLLQRGALQSQYSYIAGPTITFYLLHGYIVRCTLYMDI